MATLTKAAKNGKAARQEEEKAKEFVKASFNRALLGYARLVAKFHDLENSTKDLVEQIKGDGLGGCFDVEELGSFADGLGDSQCHIISAAPSYIPAAVTD